MTYISPSLRAAHTANRAAIDAAKREAVAKRIGEQKAVVDAEQAGRKPWVNDFWRFRTGPDEADDGYEAQVRDDYRVMQMGSRK